VYVERVREALAIVDAGKDPSRFATLNGALSHAYGWSGMLTKALSANDIALANVSKVSRSDTNFLGYSIEHWVVSLRGRLLARLNRLAEARECLDSMIEIGQRLFDPTVQIIAHFGYLDVAWCEHDKDLAQHHARHILQIADRYPSPYLRVFALAGTGMAKLVAGEFAQSCDDWVEGIAFVRKTRAAMETEAEMLANLAECHYRQGNYALARSVGEEAIALAQRRSARLPECRALMSVAGAVIRQDGQAAASEASALLDRAATLIADSGASIYQPLLTSERAALAACCGVPHQ
jgi:adenylate cyclase